MAETVITHEQVLHVAKLAHLALEQTEVQQLTQELGVILHYVERLNELDTTEVEPTVQVGVRALPLRPDEPGPSLARAQVLEQCPQPGHDGFVVPAFIED